MEKCFTSKGIKGRDSNGTKGIALSNGAIGRDERSQGRTRSVRTRSVRKASRGGVLRMRRGSW